MELSTHLKSLELWCKASIRSLDKQLDKLRQFKDQGIPHTHIDVTRLT